MADEHDKPSKLRRRWLQVSLRTLLIGACFLLASCGKNNSASTDAHVALGDTKAMMLTKMKDIGGRDVTSETQYEFYHSISGKQEYYWWELPDKTIVAVLLAGPDMDNLSVMTIEIGEPGKGLSSIANWRSQKLKRISSNGD